MQQSERGEGRERGKGLTASHHDGGLLACTQGIGGAGELAIRMVACMQQRGGAVDSQTRQGWCPAAEGGGGRAMEDDSWPVGWCHRAGEGGPSRGRHHNQDVLPIYMLPMCPTRPPPLTPTKVQVQYCLAPRSPHGFSK